MRRNSRFFNYCSVPEKKCRLTIKVQPGASRNEVAGEQRGAIRIKLQAPPVDGRANDALISFLASVLNLRARAFEIVAGSRNRNKIIAIEGLDEDEARTRLLNDS